MQTPYLPINKRYGYYFNTLAYDPPANTHTIEHPSFGKSLVRQWEYLKQYQERYNTVIRAKRIPLLQKLELAKKTKNESLVKSIKDQLAQEPNQLFRDVHINLLKELIIIARKQVIYNNTYLYQEGFHKIATSQPYSVQASYPVLSNNTGGCTHKTVYRRLMRLQTAGFFASVEGVSGPIAGKVFRGTNAAFELHLAPNILLIYDVENPSFCPKLRLPGKTEQWASPVDRSTNGHDISLLKRLDNSTIEDKRIVNTPPGYHQEPKTAKADTETTLKRTPEKCRKIENSVRLNSPGEKQKIKQKIAAKNTVMAAQNFGNDLEKYAFAKVVLLLKAYCSTVLSHIDFNAGYLCKVEDFILQQFFKDLSSEDAIDATITRITEVIQHYQKYIAAAPHERFGLFPHLFFNLNRKPRHKKDYSGYLGQIRLIKVKNSWNEFSQLKQQREKQHKFNRQKTLFLRALKAHEARQPGFTQALRLRKYVAQKCPQMQQYLDQYQAFGQWPIIKTPKL